MYLTKQQAAAEQIGDAMKLWQDGNLASAITLAGAAECSLPDKGDETLFAYLKSLGMGSLQLSEKEVASQHLNFARNWLKHRTADAEIELSELDGFLMIMRAYTSFLMIYGEGAKTLAMLSFEVEVRAAIGEFLAPLLAPLKELARELSKRS